MKKTMTVIKWLLALCSWLSAFQFTPKKISFKENRCESSAAGQPGDLYDLWTRHIATYLGKHIPGNPSVTVQNMPGAGSVIAANYVYNVAKPDGLTLGSLNPGIYMDQLIGRKEVQFDWAKFNWLGTPEQTESVFFFRGDSPYKTIDDLRKANDPPRCGSTGTGLDDLSYSQTLRGSVRRQILPSSPDIKAPQTST